MIRIIVGLALVAGFFAGWGGAGGWVLWIGLVPPLTGLFATCPLYSILGVSTCPMKS